MKSLKAPPLQEQGPLGFRTLIRRRPGLFLGAMLAASIAQVAGIPLALLTRQMVKLVSHESAAQADLTDVHATLYKLGAFLIGLSALRGMALWARSVLGEAFAQRTIADLRKNMLQHVHYLSMGYFDRRATGKVVIRFVGDALGLRGWLANRMIGIPADIITLLFVVVAIASIDVQLCYAAVLPIIVFLPATLLLNPRSRRWTREGRKEQSRLTGNLTDRVRMMSDLKAANAQEASLAPLFKRVDAVGSAFIRRAYVDAWGRAAAITSGSLSICAVGIWGALLILRGQQTSGDIVGVVWLAVLLRGPVNRLISSNIAYQRVRVGFDRINALLAREPEPGWNEGQTPYTGKRLRIRLRSLGYRDQHDRWVLRGVDATLQGPGYVVVRGERRAVHTLCELILRIRRAHEGRIGLDGTNARKLRIQDIRSRIGWVDARRGSVQATLLTHDPEEVLRSLEQTAQIPSETISLEELQHMRSFEERVQLSGGRGLRLALACALIDDPPVLLIDDADAALNPEQMRGFEAWLETESERRLILVSTSRPWLESRALAILDLGVQTRK